MVEIKKNINEEFGARDEETGIRITLLIKWIKERIENI